MKPDFTKPRPDFTRLQNDLEEHTARIISARVIAHALIEGEEAKKQIMADKLLIKGLSEAVQAAKKSIADAKAAPAALQTSAAALVATCADLKTQVDAMHEDIKFEASQLGNTGGTASS